MLRQGTIISDRYELVSQLGTGGTGVVWRASDRLLARDVAVKFLNPRSFFNQLNPDQAKNKFLDESRTIASMQHPHIVRLYDLGFHQDDNDSELIYMIMRYAENGSLRAKISSRPINLDEVTRILRQVGQALDYIHDKQFVHRDIKPDNILFDFQGNALVADFGIAKMFEDGTGVTATQGVGSTSYMPPEQIHGHRLYPASDLYALGITLYEMLTGKCPERDEANRVQLEYPLPMDIRSVIEKATKVGRITRYQTMTEFLQAYTIAIFPKSRAISREITAEDVERWLEEHIVQYFGQQVSIPKPIFLTKISELLNQYNIDLGELSEVFEDTSTKRRYKDLLSASNLSFLPTYQQILCMILLHRQFDIHQILDIVNPELSQLNIRLQIPPSELIGPSNLERIWDS